MARLRSGELARAIHVQAWAMYDISFAVSVTSYTLWFLHDDAVWGRPPPSAAPVG